MKIIIIITCSLFLFCGCGQRLISGVSSIPNIEDKFGKPTERILVLSVWEEYPPKVKVMQPERTRFRTNNKTFYFFGDPLLLTVNELPDLYNKIPISENNWVGRRYINDVVIINGIVIISETGEMVRIFCYPKTWGKVRCETMNDSYINQEWRGDLVRAINESSGKLAYPDDAISGLYEMFSKKYKIPWNSNNKETIIEFLNGIKY